MGEAVEFDGISGYLAVGEGPGIVVLHEWWGLVPHIKDVCDRFAQLGFTGSRRTSITAPQQRIPSPTTPRNS